jgi:uncharacterized membrane protein
MLPTAKEDLLVESRAKLVGHAIHPMLIVFPLGLLGMATIFDLIYLGTGSRDLATASFWMIAAGVIMGLLAAVFGLWDWLAVPGGTRARTVGLYHGIGNVVVVVLFLIAWLVRLNAPGGALPYAPNGVPIVLEVIGLLLALVTGWLGGELVERLGVGVDEGAHLQAPNSLSGRPARSSGEAPHVDAPRRGA